MHINTHTHTLLVMKRLSKSNKLSHSLFIAAAIHLKHMSHGMGLDRVSVIQMSCYINLFLHVRLRGGVIHFNGILLSHRANINHYRDS